MILAATCLSFSAAPLQAIPATPPKSTATAAPQPPAETGPLTLEAELAAASGKLSELPPEILDHLDAMTFRWLREYVPYIITPREREIFISLETTAQRLRFIERFWKRRDPTPGTPINEFRDEHVRRFSYANRRFGAGKPGWKTDRGRVYIMLGAPQGRQSNPMGRQGGERASEVWSYNGVKSRTLESSFDLSFVDFNDTGDYQIVSNLELAAPIRSYVGYIGDPLDLISRSLQADKILNPEDTYYQRELFKANNLALDQFDLMDDLVAIRQAAQETDLPKTEIETHVQFSNFPLELSIAYFKAGGGLTRVQLTFTLDFSPMKSKLYQELYYFHAELLSRLHQGEEQGRIIDQLREDIPFQVPENELSSVSQTPLVYQYEHYAKPGIYSLELLVRDAVSSRISVTRKKLVVPNLGSQGLGMSTPLLCESIQQLKGPVPGNGKFQIGDLRLLPKVSGTFRSSETMWAYLQVYGAANDASSQTHLELDYRIWTKEGALLLRTPTQRAEGASGDSVALYSGISLSRLQAGAYELEVLVKDTVSKNRIVRRVSFQVGN